MCQEDKEEEEVLPFAGGVSQLVITTHHFNCPSEFFGGALEISFFPRRGAISHIEEWRNETLKYDYLLVHHIF